MPYIFDAMKETELSDLSFAETLTELMKEKGLTFRSLSELSGLDHSYLSRLAKGGTYRASDKAIKKIAQALGIQPSYFREWRMRRLEEYLLSRIGKEEVVLSPKEEELIRERVGVLRRRNP